MSQRQPVRHYTPSNPPQNDADAVRALEHARLQCRRITEELGTKTVNNFRGKTRFEDWKKSANTALGHFQDEVKYLESLLNSKASPGVPGDLKPSKFLPAGSIASRERLLAEVKKVTQQPKYQAVFSLASPPSDITVLSERRQVLADQLTDLHSRRHGFDKIAADLGLSTEYARYALQPLIELLGRLQAEQTFLNKLARNEAGYEFSPVPSNNPELCSLNEKLSELKKKTGMQACDMLVYIMKIVERNLGFMCFQDDEVLTIVDIREYCAVTAKRTAIEYPEPPK